MKSSKERKMERKRKNKELSVAKSEASHKRRLDNKAKRDEIHAINPDMKVKVINQVTYNYLGTEIMVENSKIKTVSKRFDQKLQDKIDEIEEVEAVEVDDISRFQTLIKKWRK